MKYIIIDRDKLNNIFLTVKDEINNQPSMVWVRWFGFLFSMTITLGVTVCSTTDYRRDYIYYIFIIILVILSLIIIVLTLTYKNKIIKYYFSNNTKILELDLIQQKIEDASEYKEEQTLIVLDIKEGKEYLFPVANNDRRRNCYMFPFLKNMEAYRQEDGQFKNEEIIEQVQGMLDTKLLLNFCEIQNMDVRGTALNMEDLMVDFHFKYIHLYPESAFLKSHFQDLISKKYKYKSIRELVENRETILNNTLAVTSIENNLQSIQKSVQCYSHRKTGIVWNIDKECDVNCRMCAYGTKIDRKMTLAQKKRVIDAMHDIDVNSLDFAVGSKVEIDELKEIILYAREIHPVMDIKLTATAVILEKIESDFFKNNNIGVDITYDVPTNLTSDSQYRPCSYNKENFKIAKDLITEGVKVHAHVVIHEQNTEHIEYLQEITGVLNKIGIEEILYIRLMPVGRLRLKDYPNVLLRKDSYSGLLAIVKNDPDRLKLHCALQGLTGENVSCQLGCKKLGISPNGDVFSCPWAEHLDINNRKNPFYIGNIITSNFSFVNMLLRSDNYNDILKNNYKNQPHCKIFAYLAGGAFEYRDRLYSNI